MAKVETNCRKISARLVTEGWTNVGGGSHDRFVQVNYPGAMIVVLRHKELTPGTARSIAKSAGWI